MTDDEILRGVGLNELLDNMDHMFTKGRVLKAMEQARADERTEVADNIQVAIMSKKYDDFMDALGKLQAKYELQLFTESPKGLRLIDLTTCEEIYGSEES
jgi:hypothetical protein